MGLFACVEKLEVHSLGYVRRYGVRRYSVTPHLSDVLTLSLMTREMEIPSALHH